MMLPGVPGSDVLRTLRAASPVPIIIVSARSSEVDRVLGLELGADDYLTKPFSMTELVSRVRALLRRRELDPARPRRHHPRRWAARSTPRAQEAFVDGRLVYLTPSQFKVLVLLAETPAGSCRAARSWSGSGRARTSATSTPARCTSPTSATRSNATRPGRERIVTVRGLGYRLADAEPPVRNLTRS